MAVFQKLCHYQITGRNPSRILQPVLLKVAETQVQQTVTDNVFPFAYSRFLPMWVQVDVPIIGNISPVVFGNGIVVTAIYNYFVCKAV